jgi:hypothetical protein
MCTYHAPALVAVDKPCEFFEEKKESGALNRALEAHFGTLWRVLGRWR